MQTQIIAIGTNHKKAPVDIREKFSLSVIQQDLLISLLMQQPEVFETFVLSTCNRVEVYAHVLDSIQGYWALLRRLFQIRHLPLQEPYSQYFYRYSGQEAVQHLLQVACGLDSQVLGEEQILNQIKHAMERARRNGSFGRTFNILANVTMRTGKRARHETDINAGGSSVSWAAVEMAEQLLGGLRGKTALIVGAGKMGELTTQQVNNKKLSKIYVMNRTHEAAQTLAHRYRGQAFPFCDIKEALSAVDLCLCSAGAPHYILERETVERVMRLRQGRPLLLLDISVPRNIDPAVATLPDVRLFSIDDLDDVVTETMRRRQAAVYDVEHLIQFQAAEFYRKIIRRTEVATAGVQPAS